MAKPITTQEELNELFEWAKDEGYPYMGDRWILNDEDGTLTVTDVFEADGECEEESICSTLEELHESIYCWQHDC